MVWGLERDDLQGPFQHKPIYDFMTDTLTCPIPVPHGSHDPSFLTSLKMASGPQQTFLVFWVKP